MSESTLSFEFSKSFRDKLIVKNLPPYSVEGVYTPPSSQITYEEVLSNYSVVDGPNEYISNSPFSDRLYPLNQFGPEGGYDKNINYNNENVSVNSNMGPYEPVETNLDLINEFFIDAAFIKNIYGPEGGYQDMFFVSDIANNDKIYLPYWDPPIFRPSSYNAYNILLSDNPVGSDGLVSQDSYLVQISAKKLQEILKLRAALEDNQDVKLISDPTAFSTPSAASNQLRGNLITPNNDYRVTLPPQTDTFLTRIQGVYIPSSPIPGDYFLDEQSTRSVTSIGQAVNIFAGRSTTLGDILGPAVSRVINPSIVFLENTGAGQKSALFQNLAYNRYKPEYGSTSLAGLATNTLLTGINAILNATGTQLPGDFYVGSVISNPTNVSSPVNEVPIDAFGRETGALVYGPSELAILYEGNESSINFGLPARSLSDGGGIDGSFVWVSPKYKQNAGFKVGPGGKITTPDEEFNQISSDYNNSLSTNIEFKVGSILDETQRLIKAADFVRGDKRLRHVGNAMNQVSKVFNDGYKEMTKGSQVMSYQTQNGVEVGVEYCRVFAKDTPYYTFSDLQKTEGNIRKFSYSVLDNTYNLNIAPLKGENSTNITNGRVKKYMFSIENLAWKNSNRPGYRVDDLPQCEIGPNGGRIMWFPPYDIKFNETSTPSFNPTTFLGRPEPIYTYKDTNRTGSLSWKIVVDHPSILNVIVNKVLENERNRVKLNSVIDSFFAGCKKYDIYELAAKYNQIPSKDLLAYQEILSDPRLTREQLASVNSSIPKDNTSAGNAQQTTTPSTDNLSSYNISFYFQKGNPVSDTSYETSYSQYPSTEFKQLNVTPEYERLVEFTKKLLEQLQTTTSKITISWDGSVSYDENFGIEPLIQRRVDSVITFLREYNVDGKNLSEFIDNGRLILQSNFSQSTSVNITQGSYNCASESSIDDDISANVCRSVRIKSVEVDTSPSNTPIEEQPVPDINTLQQGLKPQPNTDPLDNLKKGLSKKVIRQLLSECDYFDVIEQTNPMVYDSIKEKIKYFNPAFHSMTPEGLNTRLTFLQQCVRPGDTIPTVTEDGQARFNDAVNTAYGTPPILVLRVGDFYNTKIVPTSLQLTYEPLIFDLNPEGIGVQPMIANVTLGFNFIGGSGLAKPVEQLQNALSFNYYANTEMYDERAEATEDTTQIDKQLFQTILENEPVIPKPEDRKTNDGGTTIGTILTTNFSSTGVTGTTKFETIFDTMIDTTQEYFDLIINQNKTLIESFNRFTMEMVGIERNYTQGTTLSQNAPIYGKPNDVETKVSQVTNQILTDIDNGTNPIINYLAGKGFDFINVPELSNLKTNLKDYVNTYTTEYSSGIFETIQKIVDVEQTYVQNIRKLNFVAGLLDGKIDNTGDGVIYNLSPTTGVTKSPQNYVDTLQEFTGDYQLIGSALTNYDSFLTTNGVQVTNTTTPSTLTTQEFNFYKLLSKVFVDKAKFDEFKSVIIKGGLVSYNKPKKLSVEFDKVCDELRDKFGKQHRNDVKFIDNIMKESSFKEFKKFTPYSKGKTREFTFDSNPLGNTTQIKDLKDLYKQTNVNSDPSTYLGKIKFD